MTIKKLHSHFDRMIILLLISGFLIHMGFIFLNDFNFLIQIVADDMFYWLEIIKKLPENGFFTVDGINPTNGFHLLFPLLVYPFSLILADKAIIYFSLILLSLFNLGTAFFIYTILKQKRNKKIAFFGAFLWILNFFLIRTILTGVEVAVSAFWLSVFLYLFYCKNFNKKNALLMSFTGILCFLARSDTIIILFVFFSYYLFKFGFKDRRVINLITPISIFLILFVVTNHIIYGYPMQVSGITQAFQRRVVFHKGDDGAGVQENYNINQILLWGISEFFRYLSYFINNVFLFSLVILFLVKPGFNIKNYLTLLSFFLILSFYAFYLWHFQIWYFVTPYLLLLLFFMLNTKKIDLKILLFFVLIFVFYQVIFTDLMLYESQLYRYRAAIYLKDNLPQNELIGSFASGIYSYFSNHTVVNLDAMVNNEAHEALVRKSIGEYIFAHKITKIIDYDYTLKFYQDYFSEKGFIHNTTLIKRLRSNSQGDKIIWLLDLSDTPERPKNISFSNESSIKYLSLGWHGMEPEGRWMDKKAKVYLNTTNCSRLFINIFMKNPHEEVILNVTANQNSESKKVDVGTNSFNITESDYIILESNNYWNPYEYGESADNRDLSIFVNRIWCE